MSKRNNYNPVLTSVICRKYKYKRLNEHKILEFYKLNVTIIKSYIIIYLVK